MFLYNFLDLYNRELFFKVKWGVMEREIVYKNLQVLREAVMHHQEILIDTEDQDILIVISPKEWKEENNQRRKDRTKFVISKTIAYCPSVFEEDMGLKDSIFSMSKELIKYFNDRQMGPLAELMHEYIKNEKDKDAMLFDYYYKKGT